MQMSRLASTGAAVHSVEVIWTVLHPVDDHDFVCGTGKDKDWMIEELLGMRFISRRDLASNSEVEEEKRDLASSNGEVEEEKTEV